MTERTRKAYPSDLNDIQWDLVLPHIPPKTGKGRNQEVDLREIVNAILYWIAALVRDKPKLFLKRLGFLN